MMRLLMFVIITCTVISCKRDPYSRSQERDATVQDDSHTSESYLITGFTDQTEFFVEYTELVYGEPSTFTIHVTQLATYHPFTGGTVSVKLTGSGSTTTAIAEPADIPGIFIAEILPPGQGLTKLCLQQTGDDVYQELCIDSMNVASNSHSDAGHNLDEQASGEHSHEDPVGGGTVFTKEQVWNTDFMVKEIVPEDFSGIIHTSGEIIPVPEEKQIITARAPGIIHFIKQDLVVGCGVDKGEQLIGISGDDIAADNINVRLAGFREEFLNSKNEYLRHRGLFAESAVSEKEYQRSRTNYLKDSIEYHSLSASFWDGTFRILSPVNGYIHELKVAEGQYVANGELIATISSNKLLLLRADVPQQYSRQISSIVTANIRTAYSEEIIALEEFKGVLVARGASVAENDHYLPVYFKAVNNGELIEGAYTEFFLKTEIKSGQMVVPVSAIIEELGQHYVYVQEGGEMYVKKEIIPGDNDGFRILVEKGLNFGDRVVTLGAGVIKASTMSSVTAGHSH